MSNDSYTKILNRYLYIDIIMIVVLILVSTVIIILLFKFLPNEKVIKRGHDWGNKTAKRIMCVVVSIICIFAAVITGKEVFNIKSDLKEEAFISCNGSYSTTRNEMVVKTKNGNIIKLKYLHSTLDDFESEYAEIIYSARSHILLSCKVK